MTDPRAEALALLDSGDARGAVSVALAALDAAREHEHALELALRREQRGQRKREMPLFAAPGKTDTSRAAADRLAGYLEGARGEILYAVRCSNGRTCASLAKLTGISLLTVRPRVTELSQAGYIRDSGRREGGAIVWVAREVGS